MTTEDFDNKWNAKPFIVLTHRMDSFIELYNTKQKEDYPFKVNILGFGITVITSKEHLLERIRELSQILKIDMDGIYKQDNTEITRHI